MRNSLMTLAAALLAAALVGCGAFGTPTPALTLTPYPTPVPRSTLTPWPTFAPNPTPGPAVDLRNLYCQYNFCIGVPDRVYLVDARSPNQWNNYASGFLRSEGAPVMVFYATTGADWDAVAAIARVAGRAEKLGPVTEEAMGAVKVYYQTVHGTEPAMSLIGVWTCGDREFAMAVYAGEPAVALDKLRDAAGRFMCAR